MQQTRALLDGSETLTTQTSEITSHPGDSIREIRLQEICDMMQQSINHQKAKMEQLERRLTIKRGTRLIRSNNGHTKPTLKCNTELPSQLNDKKQSFTNKPCKIKNNSSPSINKLFKNINIENNRNIMKPSNNKNIKISIVYMKNH